MFSPQLLIRFLLACCFIWVPLQSFDLWLYDHLFRLKPLPQKEPDIVLVTYSPGKLQQYLSLAEASTDIWYPTFYTKLSKQLSRANPRLIIFLEQYKKIDGSYKKFKIDSPILFSSSIDSDGKVIPPLTQFANEFSFGFNNLFLDSDNVFRTTPLIYSSEKSIGIIAFELLIQQPFSTDLTKPSRIFFRGPENTFRKTDAQEVLSSDKSSDIFKNKVILVGKESGALGDIDTPMGKMSFLEVHANILNTLTNHLSISSLSSPWRHLITILSLALTITLIFLFPLSIGSAFLLLWSCLLSFLAFLLLVSFQVWIGLANPLFIVLSTHLLFIGYKIKLQEDKQRKLQEESRLLKEIDEFKNNFISLFSHDLKTPIAKIKAIIDRLTKEAPSLPDTTVQGLKAIEKANSELSRLISDILRVTKMEAMTLSPTREVIDLNRLVESAVQRLKLLSDEKNLQIIQNLEPLFTMEGDSNLLLEVITNLLENAIKYSPPESRVIIQTRDSGNQMSVHIFDEGPGIPEDELLRVTTKFYRGKNASSSTKGTGLGLYLAKYFVELHGGSLELQSKVGVGTHVSFRLPVR